MKLNFKESAKTVPTPPFNFDATFHKPAHFPSGDNFWQPGIRWQTFRFQGQTLGVKFTDLDNSKIGVDIYSKSELSKELLDSFLQEVRYRYNLDLSGFYTKFQNDPVLGPIIQKWSGLRPGHQDSLYEYLIIGVLLQNCAVRRSVQMMQTLFEHYGTLLEFDSQKLWCFWSPGDLVKVTEEELRSLKIGYRAKSLKKIDQHFAANLVDENKLRLQDIDTQRRELIKLYGVGPATVWYLLFDVFHHYDFFDHISPWEQKIYSKLFFDVDPATPVPVNKILERFKHFHPYEQLAVNYIWEDLWWRRKNQPVPWLEKLIRI